MPLIRSRKIGELDPKLFRGIKMSECAYDYSKEEENKYSWRQYSINKHANYDLFSHVGEVLGLDMSERSMMIHKITGSVFEHADFMDTGIKVILLETTAKSPPVLSVDRYCRRLIRGVEYTFNDYRNHYISAGSEDTYTLLTIEKR